MATPAKIPKKLESKSKNKENCINCIAKNNPKKYNKLMTTTLFGFLS